MKFKYYYYSEINIIILKEKEEVIPEYDSIDKTKAIIINLETKQVDNLYDFFRKNILSMIINNNFENMEVDDVLIKNEDFFDDEPFKKLMELINNEITTCNTYLSNYKEAMSN